MSAIADIQRNEEGFLEDASQWNDDVAKEIAKELNINLTDKHWEIIKYLREQNDNGVAMSIRKMGKSGLVDIKEFYTLFPGGPLKNASKIAGLPRPTSCV